MLVGGGGAGWRGIKGRKKWDNCNSIINKIYFKKEVLDKVSSNLSNIHESFRTYQDCGIYFFL